MVLQALLFPRESGYPEMIQDYQNQNLNGLKLKANRDKVHLMWLPERGLFNKFEPEVENKEDGNVDV